MRSRLTITLRSGRCGPALGIKNYLYFVSDSSSERGIAVYSLVAVANLNDLDSEAYLRRLCSPPPSLASPNYCHGPRLYSPLGRRLKVTFLSRTLTDGRLS
ncbi:protein of unknown function (plasmid) [Cupriavidus taiwanensis]|uniref:Uncharacterized protein n=1 Tax=Cupriavidus taiwanensis TaxID=164546 RepID=A0A375FGV6_9BURK|nr:protein of unknown function [Cupriavidus taiwanensis]SPA03312.1 protein of unknown function [Cupriavidus taiwanensis]SPA57253.1 protein of unknown function [Cupriavidus taiwanensis]SPD48872.1 protein of unknown function [Cupriavidus taiwanensis]